MSKYGIITGEFDIDTHSKSDCIMEMATVNSKGDIEYLIVIETNRDMTGKNVIIYDSLDKFHAMLYKYGHPDTPENSEI